MNTLTLDPASRANRSARFARRLGPLVSTGNGYAPLLLRLALAVTIFPHGAQKLLGWWGGYGFSATMNAFTNRMGIPAPLALAAILAEFFGPILLALGLFTRPAALAVGITMVVAALKVHLPQGFFLPGGIEFFIPVVAIAVILTVAGAGRWSLDSRLARKLEG